MTISEFSDGFTTLLNSYNTQAMFGEQASKAEITLDEYEKSVFLTQAQDIIVKQYFDQITDQTREGFDGGEIRQMDFSSLITVEDNNRDMKGYSVTSIANEIEVLIIDHEGGTTSVILQSGSVSRIEAGKVDSVWTITIPTSIVASSTVESLCNAINNALLTPDIPGSTAKVKDDIEFKVLQGESKEGSNLIRTYSINEVDTTDETYLFALPKDILVILNERLKITTDGVTKKYVVVPLNYREFDRIDSRPYSQPLKKQCWRLFQNIKGFDTISEIIPIWDAVKTNSTVSYKLRYIRRPRPIILVNLPDGLEIDGITTATECELNKIIHMDILQKAFELALATRGGGSQQRRRRSNDDEDEQ